MAASEEEGRCEQMSILTVNGLSFSYPSLDVIRDVSFEGMPGEVVSILGVNGAGKSTLLKCINRILRMSSGSVTVSGCDITSLSARELAQRMSFVIQGGKFSSTSVFDAILLGRKPYIEWDATKKDYEIVKDSIRRLGLEEYALRNVMEMSGGESQKVALARTIVQQTDVMLLDEPTSALDLKNQLEVMNIVREEVRRRNVAAVVTMHDLNLALRFSDKFLMVKDRRIYSMGGMETITVEAIKDVYGVDAEIAEVGGHKVVVPL